MIHEKIIKHTRGEFRNFYDDNGFYYIIGENNSPSPYVVATGGDGNVDEANAAFIVKAVNSYDSLLEENKQLHDRIDNLILGNWPLEYVKLKEQNNSLLEALKLITSYHNIKELDAVKDYSLITALLTAKEIIKRCDNGTN